MEAVGFEVLQTQNRRNWHRVLASAPITLATASSGDGEDLCLGDCRVRDVSPGGLYIVTRRRGVFSSGQLLRISVTIPWEMRARLPFSRLVGMGQVVRVDEAGEGLASGEYGLAVSFCGGVTTLGAIVAPR